MPRCPKGTRKNKQGVCEPINKREPEKEGDKKAEYQEDQEETLESCIQKCTETHREKTPDKTPSPDKIATPVKRPSPSPKVRRNTQKRCPKGQHRNKEGECVPKKFKKSIKMIESSASVSSISPASSVYSLSSKKSPLISRLESVDTPRKVYAREYLNHPVQLLGKKWLFQVSFSNPEQFINYKQITGTEPTGYECFIQSLFTLGLRDRKKGKQDLEEIKKNNISGIRFEKASRYFEKSFGLDTGRIIHSWKKYKFEDNNEFKNKIFS